jgi:cellulose synthase/poly-beta-1,6-N-acetylglucosamine synthase-like glycosyltransferase
MFKDTKGFKKVKQQRERIALGWVTACLFSYFEFLIRIKFTVYKNMVVILFIVHTYGTIRNTFIKGVIVPGGVNRSPIQVLSGLTVA